MFLQANSKQFSCRSIVTVDQREKPLLSVFDCVSLTVCHCFVIMEPDLVKFIQAHGMNNNNNHNDNNENN